MRSNIAQDIRLVFGKKCVYVSLILVYFALLHCITAFLSMIRYLKQNYIVWYWYDIVSEKKIWRKHWRGFLICEYFTSCSNFKLFFFYFIKNYHSSSPKHLHMLSVIRTTNCDFVFYLLQYKEKHRETQKMVSELLLGLQDFEWEFIRELFKSQKLTVL